jgi:hypothetical protein
MTKLANSAKRCLQWKRPKGLAFPQIIETAIYRLNEAFDKRKGALYKELTEEMPVFNGAVNSPRIRALRSDGAANFCALLTTLIASASLQTGYIARPVGGRWERKTWADLDGLAYGPRTQGERSFRRTERHARALVDLGLITVRELRIKRGDTYESLAAVKRTSLKLWRLLGLEKAVLAASKRIKEEGRAAKAKLHGLTVIQGIEKALTAPKRKLSQKQATNPAPPPQIPPKPPRIEQTYPSRPSIDELIALYK